MLSVNFDLLMIIHNQIFTCQYNFETCGLIFVTKMNFQSSSLWDILFCDINFSSDLLKVKRIWHRARFTECCYLCSLRRIVRTRQVVFYSDNFLIRTWPKVDSTCIFLLTRSETIHRYLNDLTEQILLIRVFNSQNSFPKTSFLH